MLLHCADGSITSCTAPAVLFQILHSVITWVTLFFYLLTIPCCRAWYFHLLWIMISSQCSTCSWCAGELCTRAAFSLLSRASLLFSHLLVLSFQIWLVDWLWWSLILLIFSLVLLAPSRPTQSRFSDTAEHNQGTFFELHSTVHFFFVLTQDL